MMLDWSLGIVRYGEELANAYPISDAKLCRPKVSKTKQGHLLVDPKSKQ